MIDIFSEKEKLELSQKRKRSAVSSREIRKLAAAATFTAEPIAEYVQWWLRQFHLTVDVEFAGYNQVFQELLEASSMLSTNRGVNLLMIRFEDWIRENHGGDNNDDQTCQKLETGFEELTKILEHKVKKVPYLVGVFPVSTHLSLSPKVIRHLEIMTRRWNRILEALDNVYVVDFTRLDRMYNIKEIFDPLTDREGHLPFSNAFYAAMGTVIARKVYALNRQPFKVVALDCDNTLWKGICGEDGPLGVRIQGPWLELQHFMLRKYNEGMLLTLCSKNNEADVWEVFEKNPHIILKKDHFVGWQINWKPKSGNLRELAHELNLGIDSFILVDDSPTECYEVMTHCPEVLTLQLPRDAGQIPMFLQHAWAFDNLKLTDEDRARARMYSQERERKKAETESPSLADFLSGLGLKVSMNPVKPHQVPRVAQLTQRTNQFNLSTIRRTEEEITALTQQEDRDTDTDKVCWAVEVSDRFGAYGLVGVVISIRQKETLFIDTFLLSCRVLGRGVEDVILAGLKTYCDTCQINRLEAHFYPTPKNRPFQLFLERAWNLHQAGETVSSYILPKEKILDSLEYVDFYYLREFEREAPEAAGPAAEPDAVTVEYAPGVFMENRWEVHTVNREKLVHKQQYLPLENNTARDLSALPTGEGEGRPLSAAPYVGPRDETERKLVEIWQEILKVRPIGIDDSFFETGGNSVKATMMVSKIHNIFNVNVLLSHVFKTPRIRALARYVKSAEPNKYESIEPAEKRAYYPLSPTQQRFYVLQQMDIDSTFYNMPMVLELEGEPDQDKLQQVFEKLIHRHESLRTSFRIVNEEPVQVIHKTAAFSIEYRDLPLPPSRSHLSLISQFIRPFDLSEAPLLRMGLIRLEKGKHILVFDMHHIISDGYSLNIFINEYMSIYGGEELRPLRIQFKDFCQWKNHQLGSGKLKDQEEYWLGQFAGDLPISNMYCDFPRPKVQRFEGDTIHFGIDWDLIHRLKKLVDDTDTTLFMVMFAVYTVLLSKYSRQEDIIVGTTTAGREHTDLENMIGLMIETLAVRNYPGMSKTFSGFLQEIKTNTLGAFDNQAYPFRELIRQVADETDLSRNPLFDAMLIFQDMDFRDLEIEGLTFRPYEFEAGTAKLDLTLYAGEVREGMQLTLEFCTALFKKKTMERFCSHFINILCQVVENPSNPLWAIDMMTETEKQQILEEFNGTTADYPKEKTLHELFAEQVAKTPDSIALIGPIGPITLSYKELDEKSSQLAHILREKGVEPESIVAIMVEPSVEMMIGLLGILKAGGAFLPIDPEYPDERIRYMLTDSGTRFLLTDLPQRHHFNCQLSIVNYQLSMSTASHSLTHFTHLTQPTHLCYIIYTSGSTGKPKGVMVEHRNLVANLFAFEREFDIGPRDIVIQQASFAFDAFAEEVYPILLKGGKIVIPRRYEVKDIDLLADFAAKHQVGVIDCSPLLLDQLNKLGTTRLKSIHTFISGGDLLKSRYIDKLQETGTVYNTYGPTETTICASYYRCPDASETNIPIGKPITNYKLYVMDKNDQLQPMGVPGELSISGPGVTRGYLNNPELAAKTFNRSYKSYMNYISYKTGDLARWLPDGNIEFIGRIDRQVKVRGFRIEPGEIEARLLSHENIEAAAVLAVEKENSTQLYAFIVSEKAFNASRLREFLSAHLPGFMIPAYFVQVESIPLTPAKKIDRRALLWQSKETLGTDRVHTAPRTETEKTLHRIWQEILAVDKVDKIGINDSFFQLGGDSLRATVMASRIHKELKVKIPIIEIFAVPFIAGLAGYIEGLVKQSYVSVEPVEEKEYYPLSAAQKRLYFLQQIDPDSTGYNLPQIIQLEEEQNLERLEASFKQLIQRHESLRTSFELVEDRPVQRVHKNVQFKINYYDQPLAQPFDLSQAPLLRVGLSETGDGTSLLMVDMHHIITDATSQGILIREFISLYRGQSLPPLRIRYRDYTHWLHRDQQVEIVKKQEAYWLDRFHGDVPVLHLPTDHARPPVWRPEGNTLRFEITARETRALKALALEENVSLYMVLFALFTLLLAKLSGEEEIVVGSPSAGRRHLDLESVIGMFVNTLAFRFFPAGEKTFRQFLQEVKTTALKGFENQEYPFESIVEKVVRTRDTSRNPLFDVMFVLQNTEHPSALISEARLPGLKVLPYDSLKKASKFDLTLEAIEMRENLTFSLEYSTVLFEEETVRRFIAYFRKIAVSTPNVPGTRLSSLEIITPEEKRQILEDFNDTTTQYPKNKTIHQLFEEQAAKIPDHIALKGPICPIGPIALSYKELDKKCGQLAQLLREKGVQPGTIAGIKVERSVEMVIGILAILKAGGIYLPIDPGYPEERINYMIQDSGVKVLLTEKDVGNRPACSSTSLTTDLAYIIYTSGSTGTPKGIMVEHASVVNILFYLFKTYPFSERDTYLLKTPFIFDVSVSELFGWFLGGGRLAVLAKDEEKDPWKITAAIERYGVTHINFVPSMFTVFVKALGRQDNRAFNRLKYIFLAGEALLPEVVSKFREINQTAALENIYGPTEATIYASKYSLHRWNGTGSIPIGKPVGNTRFFILDKYNRLQPVGVPGELNIAGDGLARGYLNRPELTAKRFNRSYKSYGTYISYKTGDLARWLPDGNIEYLGRMDHQVKVRGFRIELGEIENRLLSHKKIKETVVTTRGGDEGESPYLCAYIVCEEGDKNRSRISMELRDYLSHLLPDYMVPLYYVVLERIPLTPGGKVNRKALPPPQLEAGEDYTAPTDEIEEKLAETWKQLLPQSTIGCDDHFFRLGGHSLKAIQLVSKIHKAFHVKLPLAAIFKYPTVRGMARSIRKAAENTFTVIKPVETREFYAASSSQERLCILHQMEPVGYNISMAALLEGELDRERIKDTFMQLIQRHECLRTSFHLQGGEFVQEIHDCTAFEIEYDNLAAEGCNPQSVIHKIRNFIRPFDLSKAPLLRVGLIQTADTEHLLMVDIHHTVSDGTSLTILANDFMDLYEGRELEPLPIQYKDYSQWMRTQKERENIRKQEAYWLKEFEGQLPKLDLPIDFKRPAVQSFEGKHRSFIIDSPQVEALKRLAEKEAATLYIVLMSVFNILLSKLSSQEEVCVGIPIAGRRHADLEKIIGMFVNTLVLRSFPVGIKTFREFFKEVREKMLKAYENQEYQLEDLVEQVEMERDAGRNPLFDAVMVLQNMAPLELEIPGLKLRHYDYETNVAQFDLIFNGSEENGKLFFSVEYCSKLFKEETIERFINYFKHLVTSVLRTPDREISRLEMIPEQEKTRLLHEFNDTDVAYPGNKTVHQLFEEQTAKAGDRVAVLGMANQQLSYRELNKKANQMARLLREKGTGRDTVVAMRLERSIEMITGILGILKAGGAYLPIDTDYPFKRVVSILEETNAPFLLTSTELSKDIPFTPSLLHRGERVEPVVTARRPQVTDFDSLPMPDRTLIDYGKYQQHIGIAMAKHTVSLQASRGCPYNCAYCSKIWPKNYVSRSAEHIFEEIRRCYDAGVKRFVFIDDVFNLNRKNSARLLETIIKQNMDIQLFFPNGLRGDILTRDFIDLMMEAGTVNIALALESASPRIQALIDKNLKLEIFKENVDYITRKYPHLLLEMELMVGFPTETEEEAQMTLDFMKGVRWLHFPNLHILKIFPNTDMYRLAKAQGVPEESIAASADLAYHQLPATLPFPENFARQLQAELMQDYFLLKERLFHVLPQQMKVLTEEELVQKYDSYLPADIKTFPDILEAVDISREFLPEGVDFLEEDRMAAPDFTARLNTPARGNAGKKSGDIFRVLLLDVSQLFSAESGGMLYDMVEEPLGLIYLATYIHETFGTRVQGKVAKSRIDFDSYDALKRLMEDFKPHLIGIRSLSYYKAFFHRTVSVIRQWGITVPIAAGGPYASSDYRMLLSDHNVDLAVLGEGELTLVDLIGKMTANNNRLPGEEVLKQVKGIAFIKEQDRTRLRQGNGEIIRVDQMADRLGQYPVENPEHINRPEDLLYLISTSGSTGRPKSVMLEHCNMVNLLNFGFSGTNVDFSGHVLQFASIGFDASAQEIFSALLKGGKLFLISKDMRADLLQLFEFIRTNDIAILFLPPAFLKLVFTHLDFAAAFPRSVRHICAAGEQLIVPEPFKRHLAAHKVFLHNYYGPAETHVVTTLTIDPAGTIPGRPGIGNPISNTGIYILDKYKNLQPIGVKGELYISGSNVGRGYLNNPELTEEKFNRSYKSYRSYRTGDLARWLPDGTIEFWGRADHQVKLRGFRVELEEIETQLLRQREIKEAVVIAKKDERGDMYLCAYFVPAVGDVTEQRLREALAAVLPDYMVPAYLIPLEKLPLNTSGKLDRKALPAPGLEAGEGHTAPTGAVQETLAAIWSEVLEVEPGIVGIDSNFFSLGGHSLKATVLLAKIYKELNVKVPLTEMFKKPTIRNLSKFIQAAREDKYRPIEPVEKKEYYAASQTQRRLYFQWQMGEGESIAYNIPQVVVLKKKPDGTKFEETFRHLIQRHESLRTSFRVVNEEPVQVIHKTAPFSIEYKYSDLPLITPFIRPFDLSRAPLLRVRLVEEKEKKYILMVDIHHIISDGISLDILVEDFKTLYAGETLAPLLVQYKDYTQWRNRQFYKERDWLTRMENYWLTQFKGEIPVLTLPLDFPRPELHSIEGGSVNFEIGKEETAAVKNTALTNDATVYMVLLAVFNILLSRLGGGEDIIVGTPTSGRKHPDLERIIGMFANALPLRNFPAAQKTFKQFLQNLRKRTLEAFENEDYPFEELLEKIKLKRDAARTPLFDVMFAFHSLDASAGNTGEEREQDSQHRISKYDMTLFALETGGRLFFTLVYCTRLFKQSTIETFTGCFKKIVADVLENPDRPIADIEMISQQEQTELLEKIRDEKGNAFAREVETMGDVRGIEAEFDF